MSHVRGCLAKERFCVAVFASSKAFLIRDIVAFWCLYYRTKLHSANKTVIQFFTCQEVTNNTQSIMCGLNAILIEISLSFSIVYLII